METGLIVQQAIEKVSDQLVALQKEGDDLAFLAEATEVHNEETLAYGRELLVQVAGINKKISGFIKPVKTAFKGMVDSFSIGAAAADKIIRGKINEYAAEQEKLRLETERKLLEEQRHAEREAAIRNRPPPPPPIPVHIDSPTDEGFRTYWKWRIEDAEKIPEKYWMRQLNEGLITKEVSEQKENCNIPGIDVYTEKKVVAR